MSMERRFDRAAYIRNARRHGRGPVAEAMPRVAVAVAVPSRWARLCWRLRQIVGL
jgi:hypothetical protein